MRGSLKSTERRPVKGIASKLSDSVAPVPILFEWTMG